MAKGGMQIRTDITLTRSHGILNDLQFVPQFDPKSGDAGSVVGEVLLRHVSSECLRFCCQFSCTDRSTASGASSTRPLVACVPSGLSHAVTGIQKNVAFWDIKTQFVLHGRHITSLLQSQAS
jgi:hypothetical protein